jgi:Protein of unknown function (DUF2948)
MDNLKLFALDMGDLAVISAHVQDAVLKLADMAYLPREQRLVLICNRFDRSPAAQGAIPGPPQRRRAALRFERVQKAQLHAIDLSKRDTVLSLLALQFEAAPNSSETDPAGAEPSGHVTLIFAGEAAVRLAVETIEVALEDLGPAWAAAASPRHPDKD